MLPAFGVTGEERKAAYWRTFQRERMKFAGSVGGHVFTVLRRQLNVVAGAVEAVTSHTLAEQAAAAAIDASEKEVQAMFQRIYVSVAPHFAGGVYTAMAKAAGVPEYKKTPANLTEQWIRAAIAYVERVAGWRIVGIQKTTHEQIRQAIIEGIDEGLSIQKIARKLRTETSLRETYTNRAVVIARTEVIAASNFGSQAGARSTGLQLTKEWLATRDGRTREDHEQADGQKVGMENKYTVAGEALDFPGDPAGSAANVINCRCTEVYAPVA